MNSNTGKELHSLASSPESAHSTRSSMRITVINYNHDKLEEKEIKHPEEAENYKDPRTVTWIDLDGIYNKEVVDKFSKHFELHPLVEEDIMNINQRPKAVDYGDHTYVVLKLLYYDVEKDKVEVEQLSILLNDHYLITFQQKPGDVLTEVKEHIRAGKNRIRIMKVDYLLYVIFDSVVDNYFRILEKVGEDIEILEKRVMTNPSRKTLTRLNYLKKEMINLRKSVWPLREVIRNMERDQSKLIKKETWVYFRDVYDHTIQVIDTMETYRDMLSSMIDIYLSSISNRLNEVMKVLTIISTIFIPLTFISGVYGMNFDHMPELEMWYGYPTVLSVMLVVAAVMLVYFKRQKWF